MAAQFGQEFAMHLTRQTDSLAATPEAVEAADRQRGEVTWRPVRRAGSRPPSVDSRSRVPNPDGNARGPRGSGQSRLPDGASGSGAMA